MKTYRNIIFLSSQPLIPHIKNSIYMKELMEAGFHVEFWCFRKLCNYKYDFPNELTDEFSDFSRKKDLFAALKRFSSDDTFVFLESIHTLSAYSVVKRFRRFDMGTLVLYRTFPYERSFYDGLKRKTSLRKKIGEIWVQHRLNKRIADYLFNRNIRITYKFQSGCEGSAANGTKLIPINYIFTGGKERPEEWRDKPYCLYIEQGWPKNQDLIHHGVNIEGNRFCESCNAFFKKIEDEYGVPVIIAGHPKSPMTSEDFGGRPFIRGCLESLIDGAEYVTGHESTAFNYAVIKHKKLALFHESFLREQVPHIAWRTDKLASLLGVESYDAEALPPHIEFKCAPEKYDRFSRDYLIGDPGRNNAQIIIDTLSGKTPTPEASRTDGPVQ